MSANETAHNVGGAEGRSATWYKVSRYGDRIERVDVLRETAEMLVLPRRPSGERRVGKGGHFRTEAEAIGYLVKRARRLVKDAERKLDAEKSRRAELRAKYPTAPEWNTPE